MAISSIWDIVSYSVVFLYAIPIILFLYTKEVLQLKILIGLFGTTFLSEFLKHQVIQESSPRPKGATNCNIACNDGNQEGKPGMPSSHSAEVAFFSSIYYFQTKNPLLRFLLVMYAVVVMASRYIKRCHTLEQIGVGSLLGLILSVALKQCVN